MSLCFSDAVEQALKDVFYNERSQRGREGLELLEQASAAGDGDASCILARCLSGPQYIWDGHNFPEDDDRAKELVCLSIKQGSAIGVLVSMRMGLLSPSLEEEMPFLSLEEAFQAVLDKAGQGDAFCQFTVGNVYFWGDFIRIYGKGPESFSSRSALEDYVRENTAKCEDWFQKAFQGGMQSAGNNLYNYYLKGDQDAGIPPRPNLAKDLWQKGAELGYPRSQYLYAEQLREKNNFSEAFRWYQKAAEGGELSAFFYMGWSYELGKGVEKDLSKAVEWYEKRLEIGMQVGCCNRLGCLLYEGANGVRPDYDRAFQLLSYAYYEAGSSWGADYLGRMYFYGRGTPRDYFQARELLEGVLENARVFDPEIHYYLGVIYCQGLGVEQNITKGVEHLKKIKSFAPAKEELAKYKRTLLGKWVQK